MKLLFEDVENLRQEEPDHFNYVSKVGKRYGKLTVLFYAGKAGKMGKSQFVCLCDCGYYSLVSTLNLRPNNNKINSCGCGQAEARRLVTPEQLDERIKRVEESTPYKVVDSAGGIKHRVKWTFNCQKHGNFKAVWSNVVVKGTQCPSCACVNRGFNQMIPGYFYLNVVSKNNEPVAIKYGITNSTPEKRLHWLKFGAEEGLTLDNVFKHRFTLGADALNLETEFRRFFGKNFLSRSQLDIGFSETINYIHFEEALSWVTSKINQIIVKIN